MMHYLPVARSGQSIGLMGGSFDPPHSGHTHAALLALRRFNLDRVWWLVSPQNPLKARAPELNVQRRASLARAVARDHPGLRVTDLERHLNTRATVDTLRALKVHYPGVNFVWIMGADNLHTFHRWKHWQTIFRTLPIGVIARPEQNQAALSSRAARLFGHARLAQRDSHLLAAAPAPAWCFLHAPMVDESSTAIRAKNRDKP